MARFADVLGHEQTITHLKHAIQFHKVSHAYIINGEKVSADAYNKEKYLPRHYNVRKADLNHVWNVSPVNSPSVRISRILYGLHTRSLELSAWKISGSSSMEIFLSSLIAAFIKSILLTRQRNLRFRHRMRCLRR